MSRITTEEAQANHRRLVTELQQKYAAREDAQQKVNAAIRLLRAIERQCQNLGEQIANNDQLMLNLAEKGAKYE